MRVVLVAACFLVGGLVPSPTLAQTPNVLVVLLDDVGRDKVGFLGDHPNPAPTPTLDRLASEGVVFRNAWATQACSPTRAQLLTGRYADRTGIAQIVRRNDGVVTPMSTDEFTLPDALPGHHSMLIGKWHLDDSIDPATHAMACGFDTALTYVHNNEYDFWVEDLGGFKTTRGGYYPVFTAPYAARALQGLPEPFFLYYATRLAHSPFHEPPTPLRPQSPVSLTDVGRHTAMVEASDTLLGRLLPFVDLERTFVFVIGDNGSPKDTVTAPFEPDRVKSTMYEGGLRVPFLVVGPGVAKGEECHELVQVADVLATCRDLVGLGPAPQGAEDSVSFAPLLFDPTLPGDRSYLYARRFPYAGAIGPSASNPPMRAIRTARWKLIEYENTGQQELYDLEQDPFEAVDLLLTNPGPLELLIRDRLVALFPTFP